LRVVQVRRPDQVPGDEPAAADLLFLEQGGIESTLIELNMETYRTLARTQSKDPDRSPCRLPPRNDLLQGASADAVFTGEGEVALAIARSILHELGAIPEQLDETLRLLQTTSSYRWNAR
jgi:hypothetical protein